MSTVIVLGAGMVGSAMSLDLAQKHEVTVADNNSNSLKRIRCKNGNIKTIQADLRDSAFLGQLIAPFDVVLSAVPGFMGYDTLRTVIMNGKNIVDISFSPENSLELNDLAVQHGVTAIVDCGVAPGMDNVILGYYNEKMEIDYFECLVGGLPVLRKWPFNYKAPFSPVDVIEEYTRPARYLENGHLVTKPAMSDIEHVEIKGVGTLEAFNSDGLRSILHTMPHIPNMKEKTLRYPGHIEKICVLRDAGFFGKEPVTVNGREIAPLDFTSAVLFQEWKRGETEPELTVMRVTLSGKDKRSEDEKEIVYHLHDLYDEKTQTSSMARTTGYTATAAVNLFLDGLFDGKGVFPPELLGKYEICFQYFMDYLKQRGVIYTHEEELIERETVAIGLPRSMF